jgi:hypothetical protein
MEKAMGTNETAREKDVPRKPREKLKLNKESVKDLGVKKGAADAVKGAARGTRLSAGCLPEATADC